MEKFKSHIVTAVHSVCPQLSLDQIATLVEVPPDSKMGDYAFPCFQLAKHFGKNPKEIAADLATRLGCDAHYVSEVRATGPYLNFFLNRSEFISTVCREIDAKHGHYGEGEDGKGKTIVVEYSSPNIAKPFGVGHLRTTVIGAALTRIYQALGYKVVGINYLGDWGTQFGKLIEAYKRWGSEAELHKNPIRYLYDLYVRFHKEAESNPELEDLGRQWFQKLESGNTEAVLLWKQFREESIHEFEHIYEDLGIHFDEYEGESDYPKAADELVDQLLKQGVATVSDGAVIVPLGEEMPPALLRKQDGATLYLSRDLAAARARMQNYKFDQMLYVVGSEQILHFKQFFAMVSKTGDTWADRLHHIPFGRIQGISTRKGTLVFVEDLLAETSERALEKIRGGHALEEGTDEKEVAHKVGIGAIIFNDLRTRRIKDVEFSWDKVLSFEGETGPYLQYAYARIGRMLDKLGEQALPDVDYTQLNQPEAWQIARMLGNYPQVIRAAAAEYEPSFISTYLIDLASAFSTFYQNHRLMGSDPAFLKAAVTLVWCVRQVLHHGLLLLGVPPIERM